MSGTFEKPDLDLSDKRLFAVFTVHNEIARLPYFFEYYRRLGVDQFLAVDNNSTDGSAEFLQAQADVAYFHTTDSYVASKAGRLWTSELADHYCSNQWCLTLDVDELLVVPAIEHISLVRFCEYLDANGYEGIFTVFLDMYGEGSLDQAVYTPGQPFFEICPLFEVSSYELTQPMHFPQLGVYGGPRQRVFWDEGRRGRGPSMRKMPLIKWRPNFRYLYSTHSSRPVNLADVTGALLHFKFFSSFSSLAAREHARGDRVQKQDYEVYARLTQEQGVSFRTNNSVRYETASTLVEKGVVVCTKKYITEIGATLEASHGTKVAKQVDRELRSAMKLAEEGAKLPLSLLPRLWPMLSNYSDGAILGAIDRMVCGWFVNKAGGEPDTVVELQVGGRVVASAQTGISPPTHADLKEDIRENFFEINVPKGVDLSGQTTRIFICSRRSAVPFASVVMNGSTEQDGSGVLGAMYLTPQSRIVGWVWDPANSSRHVTLALFLNDQYWCRVTANQFRERLKAKGVGDGSHGFTLHLPEGLDQSVPLSVRATIQGTNFEIEGSPLVLFGQEPKHERRSRPILSKSAFRDAGWRPFARVNSDLNSRELKSEFFGARRGSLWGWVAPPAGETENLTLEVLRDGSPVFELEANQPVAAYGPVPPSIARRGFCIPWSMIKVGSAERFSVSARVTGTTYDVFEETIVSRPDRGIESLGYRGYAEESNNGRVRGWVWNPHLPEEHVRVGIFIDGLFFCSVAADHFRADLRIEKIGDGDHGFDVRLPVDLTPEQVHSLDVVVGHGGLPLADGGLVVVGTSVRRRRNLLSSSLWKDRSYLIGAIGRRVAARSK